MNFLPPIFKGVLVISLFFVISGCSNPTSHGKSIQPFYEKEGKIYYDNREVADADPNSFEVYKDIKCYAGVNCFAHDKNSVFYYSTKIQGAEPDGFKFLENGYKKDNDSVFYTMDNNLDWNIAGADAYSFYVLGRSKYFFQSERCTNLIDKTNICTEESSYAYAKDKNHAYYDGRVIPQADTSSFVLIVDSEKYDAEDKNYKYKEGSIVTDSNQN